MGTCTRTGRRAAVLVGVLVLVTSAMAGCHRAPRPGPGTTTTTTSTPPPAPVDYAAPGPFTVTTTDANATTVVYHPVELGGVRHPVLLWGNGTSVTPSAYDGLLRHLASHGFIVAAANTTNAGSGQEMLAGLDWLTAADAEVGGPFAGTVDLANVGTVGHSQGAIGALAAAKDARVKAIIPLAGAGKGLSASGKPTIYFVGQNDTVATPTAILPAYEAGTGPTAFAELAGAGHLTVLGDAGGFRSAVTAWARWQLAGDSAARAAFLGTGCMLCDTQVWSQYLTNSQFQALG
jgi:hypothetical protein